MLSHWIILFVHKILAASSKATCVRVFSETLPFLAWMQRGLHRVRHTQDKISQPSSEMFANTE